MRRGVFGLIAAGVLTVALMLPSLPSWAADKLPLKQAPVFLKAPPIPAWNWTGFQVGGDIGPGLVGDVAA
jgi:hypothetical protein